MKDWEKRYLHDRAFRDARCIAAGVEIPEDPRYGTLREPTDIRYRTRFDGERFFAALEERGHSAAEFEKCKCRREE